MKIDVTVIYAVTLDDFIVIIKGRIRVISTSKIRKIIAIKKKCIENGSRDDDLGSNPHSNGELFSRSIIVFFDVKLRAVTIKIRIIKITIEIIKSILITYTIFRSFNWKLNII